MSNVIIDPVRRRVCTASLAAAGSMWLPAAHASIAPGQGAPDFQLRDVAGRPVSLSGFRGKTVVLEWVNPNCPFVKKHYDSKNMQSLQARYTASGVVWIAINSTHPEHQDYLEPAKLAQTMSQWGAVPTATLMDTDGKVGKLYGARTTPHMYIVSPQGNLMYAGGIDDKRSANPEDVKTARNFVAQALDELQAGRPVSTATSTPYGCSVKYRS